MKLKTRAISEGALMMALIAMFLLVNRQFANVFDDMLIWLLSLPMIIYSVRYGVRLGTIVFASTLLLSIIVSSITSIIFLFSALSVGIIYAYGVNHRWSNRILLIVTIIIQLITSLITVLLLAELFGYNLGREFNELSSMITNISGVKDVKNIVLVAMIVTYFGSAILQAIVIHISAHILLKRFNLYIHDLKPLRDVQLPKIVGYLIIVSMAFYYLLTFSIIDNQWELYIMVIYYIALTIGLINGIIASITYAIAKQDRRIALLAIVLSFIPAINNLILWIGIYDLISGYHTTIGRGEEHEIHGED